MSTSTLAIIRVSALGSDLPFSPDPLGHGGHLVVAESLLQRLRRVLAEQARSQGVPVQEMRAHIILDGGPFTSVLIATLYVALRTQEKWKGIRLGRVSKRPDRYVLIDDDHVTTACMHLARDLVEAPAASAPEPFGECGAFMCAVREVEGAGLTAMSAACAVTTG